MKTTESFTPETLNLWSLPNSYAGAEWPDHYVFLGRNRDSDALTRANFDAGLEAIGCELTDEDETLLVSIIREGHWAVGWVEWIAIHKSATEQLRKADEFAAAMEDYPVVNEDKLSEYEDTEAQETWANCYDDKERLAYVRKFRNQFDFDGLSDMLGCIRGKFFCGYASDLIY